ncbi:hypothetical protein FP736_03615 [Vibrio parahaemolyticus]|nr:hypothetical protein [Vibrio parahaemolyticus]NCN90951.1 hypothetical protein [Vibrio parahaemolyticus]
MPNIYLNKFIWLYISINLLQSAIGYYRQILVIMTNTTRNISKINDFVRHKNKLKLGE